ncbi:MAG: hypothetical protein R6T83_04370 [Salinibacter sp.]
MGGSRARFLIAGLLLGGLVGCQDPTPPDTAPDAYNQLVQVAVSEAEAQTDTTLFWLRNTGTAQGRTLMLELDVDYLRYTRAEDALCVWSGEGLWPARGYVTSPEAGTVPDDSVGVLCNIEGECAAEQHSERWWEFQCS